MVGIDLLEAEDLGNRLRLTGKRAGQIHGDVLEAVTLAGFAVPVGHLLNEIEELTVRADNALDRSADIVRGFKIPLQPVAKRRLRSQNRGEVHTSDLRKPLKGGHRHWQSSFDNADDRYRAVVDAMMNGQSPTEAGIDQHLFPGAYVEWHRLNDAVIAGMIEAGQMFHRGELALAAIRIDDLESDRDRVGASFGLDGNGRLPAFAAVMAVPSLGSDSGEVAAQILASSVHDLTADELVDLADLLVKNRSSALAFFNEMGARGAALLPDLLVERDATEAMAGFANALAAVSGDEDLKFSGDEFVRAAIDYELPKKSTLDAEILLALAVFDADFVVAAAVESFKLEQVRPNQWGFYSNVALPPHLAIDPRISALHGVANAGAGAEFALALAASGQPMALVSNQSVVLGVAPEIVSDAHEYDAIVRVMAQIGESKQATASVLESLTASTSKGETSFHDVRYADGLANMISVALTTRLVPTLAQDRAMLLNAIDWVIASGGVSKLDGMMHRQIQAETLAVIESGVVSPDLTDLGVFIGEVNGRIDAAERGDARSEDASAAFKAKVTSVVFVGGSLAAAYLTAGVASPVTAAVIKYGGAGIATTRAVSDKDQPKIVAVLQDHLADALSIERGIAATITITAIQVATVIDEQGNLVTVEQVGDDWQLTVGDKSPVTMETIEFADARQFEGWNLWFENGQVDFATWIRIMNEITKGIDQGLANNIDGD